MSYKEKGVIEMLKFTVFNKNGAYLTEIEPEHVEFSEKYHTFSNGEDKDKKRLQNFQRIVLPVIKRQKNRNQWQSGPTGTIFIK